VNRLPLSAMATRLGAIDPQQPLSRGHVLAVQKPWLKRRHGHATASLWIRKGSRQVAMALRLCGPRGRNPITPFPQPPIPPI